MYIEKLNSQDFITFTESLGYMVNSAITDIRVLKGKKLTMVLVNYVDEDMENLKKTFNKYNASEHIKRIFDTASAYGINNTLVFEDFSCHNFNKDYSKPWQEYMSKKFPNYKRVLKMHEDLEKW